LGELILRDLLVIFLFAIPVILVLQFLRLPALIGFILTGALIGPSGIGLVQDAGRIEILAEIGVTLLLFVVGLEFSLAAFSKLRTFVLQGGVLQILATTAAGFVLGLALGWPPSQGFYFGCLIALSSTAVVLTSLLDHRLQESVQGRISTGILILQDLAVIPMIAFLPSFGSGGGASWTRLTSELGVTVLLIAGVALFIRYLASPIFGWVSRARSRELFLITVISFALGMAWLTYQAGLSFALGAFLGGLMIGNTDYQVEALAEMTPFRHCFNSLFFVSIGMLLDLQFLVDHLGTVMSLVLLIPTLKMAIVAGILLFLRAPLRVSLVTGIILGQIGEFSFLLASLGKKTGAFDPLLYQYVIAAAAVTMVGTPLMIRWSIPFAEVLSKFPLLKRLSRSEAEIALAQEIRTLSGHVIICGFGPLGEALGHLLDQHRIEHLILELNPETIQRIRLTKKNVFFGDGASEEILFRSGIERARLLAITTPDFLNNVAVVKQARKLNPEIRIVTRAKYRSEVEALYAAGADIVVSEELEGGIEMGRYALRELGVPMEEVDAYVKKIREFGSADFF
jgi:CPA2 family monovalent cation:H+ antiporter-2